MIVETGIPVALKMMLATGHKHLDTYMEIGYELARRMGKPEYMSVSSLGKYLNHDAGKYKFWLEKIHQALIVLNPSPEERKEAASHGHEDKIFN